MRYISGFTLIELIITIVIIAILSTISYPSFLYYLHVSRRSDAHTSLLKLASLQEQYFLYHHKYASINELMHGSVNDFLISENSFYKIKSDVTESSYFLTASAIGVQEFDSQCQIITLSHDGKKGGADNQECW